VIGSGPGPTDGSAGGPSEVNNELSDEEVERLIAARYVIRRHGNLYGADHAITAYLAAYGIDSHATQGGTLWYRAKVPVPTAHRAQRRGPQRKGSRTSFPWLRPEQG